MAFALRIPYPKIASALRRMLRPWLDRYPVLREREAVNVGETLDHYYKTAPVDRPTLLLAWMTIAHELRADPQRLRPSDRLLVELEYPRLALNKRIDDTRDWLLTYLQIKCRRANIDFRPERLITIDDCVRVLYECMMNGEL